MPRRIAQFLTDNLSSLGALNVAPILQLPRLLNIAAEWAAILPLVCHLATHRRDYNTVGETALLGRVTIGLFPKLGTYAGLSRLLSNGPDFLDRASIRGGASCTVWDTIWGTRFPCANGAVNDLLRSFIRRHSTSEHVVDMPESPAVPDLPAQMIEGVSTSPSEAASQPASPTTGARPGSETSDGQKKHFRRYQTLHVYRFRFKTQTRSIYNRIHRVLNSRAWTYSESFILVLVSIVLIFCGAYGTPAILLSSAMSRSIAVNITIERPLGYLESNEIQAEAYMLMAIHPNAQEWNLFIGERSIVDTLLNKTMVTVPRTTFNRLAARWFQVTHILHLLAMTFVAAQKAWDGIFLVFVLMLDTLFRLQLSDRQMAKHWLHDSGITADHRAFRFTGRMIMLGAIQLFSATATTSWIDEIVSPYPRRDAFLSNLRDLAAPLDRSRWNERDVVWIETNSALARVSATILVTSLQSNEV